MLDCKQATFGWDNNIKVIAMVCIEKFKGLNCLSEYVQKPNVEPWFLVMVELETMKYIVTNGDAYYYAECRPYRNNRMIVPNSARYILMDEMAPQLDIPYKPRIMLGDKSINARTWFIYEDKSVLPPIQTYIVKAIQDYVSLPL